MWELLLLQKKVKGICVYVFSFAFTCVCENVHLYVYRLRVCVCVGADVHIHVWAHANVRISLSSCVHMLLHVILLSLLRAFGSNSCRLKPIPAGPLGILL